MSKKKETIAEASERLSKWMAENPSPAFIFLKKQAALKEKLVEEVGPDYAETSSRFTINNAEQDVIDKWVESLKPEIMRLQGKNPLGGNEPYYGAVGGGLTYSFIPTSLGTILTVKETTTGKELNVSDALEWIFYG